MQAGAVVVDRVEAVVAHDPVEGAAHEVAGVVPLRGDVASVVLDEVDAEDAPRAVELGQHDEEERGPEVEEEQRAREPEGDGVLEHVLSPELVLPRERGPPLHAGERVGARHVGEVDQVEQVPPEAHVLGRGPVRLAVVVEVVVDEVVRRDVRRRGVERAEREHGAEGHVELLALEDALVQVVVDHHRVEEAEVAGAAEKQGVSTPRHEVHRGEQPHVSGDDADLSPLRRVLHEPGLAGPGNGRPPAHGPAITSLPRVNNDRARLEVRLPLLRSPLRAERRCWGGEEGACSGQANHLRGGL